MTEARFPDSWVRGALRLGGSADVSFGAIVTDTRTLAPGALFVALAGERFDAHDFLAAARDAGRSGAVVRRGTEPVPGLVLYEVDDTLRGLGDLAAAHRQSFTGPVIGITGQNGKTSTKEMVAAVLATKWRTHKTRANLNNLVGVPMTILEAPADTEALVVEAGANLPGEIPRYREIIQPDIAIVLNAGAGHLEGFGSVDGVIREKLSPHEETRRSRSSGTQPPELAPRARASWHGGVITAGLADSSGDASVPDVTPEVVTMTADGRPGRRRGRPPVHAGCARAGTRPATRCSPGRWCASSASIRPRRPGRWSGSWFPPVAASCRSTAD